MKTHVGSVCTKKYTVDANLLYNRYEGSLQKHKIGNILILFKQGGGTESCLSKWTKAIHKGANTQIFMLIVILVKMHR